MWEALSRYVAHPANALLLAWLALVVAALIALFHAHGYDDPFITYRYAANLAAGAGFVYNAGEYVLSTTTPLYALLLAVGALLGLDIPLLSNIIGSVALAAGGLAFWRFGQVWQTPVAGAVGAVLYPTLSLLVTTLGSEMPLYLALVLLGLLACATNHYTRAAVLLALATLTRADGVVAVGAVGLYALVCQRGRFSALPWHALLLYGALLVPWFGFAWAYFGAPLPATLAAKQQQGLMSQSRDYLAGLAVQVSAYWNIAAYRLHVLLAAAGVLVLVLPRYRAWGLLVGWSILYSLGYVVLGVNSYFWYYAPVVTGAVALIGLAVQAIVDLAQSRIRWQGTRAALAGVLVVLLFVPQVHSLLTFNLEGDARRHVYRRVGEWLHTHTPPDASVATLEVGIIGYYSERRVIDFAGLIQPETAARLNAHTNYEDAAIWATHHYRPDYVVLHHNVFPRLQADPLLTRACEPLETFEDATYSIPLVVYGCTW
jgi:hypothetical protein